MQPHGSWGQKQGPTVPDQRKPTPENPSQTRPIPIRTNRHTPVQSIPQVRDIHVGSYRPHECLVIVASYFLFLITTVFTFGVFSSNEKSDSHFLSSMTTESSTSIPKIKVLMFGCCT